MQSTTLFATTGDALAVLHLKPDDTIDTHLSLAGKGIMCVAADPVDPHRLYAGGYEHGLFRSLDGGHTWDDVSAGLEHKAVLSLAISGIDRPDGRGVVYAGTEPTTLYRSSDDGATWRDTPALGKLPSAPTWSFPPRPWTHHLRWIALHPTDPQTLYVGVELGGVMVTRDGGVTWEDRKPGSQFDAHALATHPLAPERVYEAAGGGVAVSADAGQTWRPADDGMDRHYAWGIAVDSADPDLWYVSASFSARQAHGRSGDAQGVLYRKRGTAPWQALGGDGSGIPRPLPWMPYALVAPRGQPGSLIVGLQDGALLLSDDAGDTWRTVDTGLGSLVALSERAMTG